MTIARVLARGRRAASLLMTDTCVIRHKTGTVFNESNGQYEDTFSDLYTGRCRVQISPLNPTGTAESAGWVATVTGYTVSVPIPDGGYGDSYQTGYGGPVVPDDMVEVTASAFDPGLVGRQLRVLSVQAKSQATARRLFCEVVEA